MMKGITFHLSRLLIAVFVCLSVIAPIAIAPAFAEKGDDDGLVMDDLRSDYQTLTSLIAAEDSLCAEMARMVKEYQPGSALSQQREEEIAGWFFSLRTVRKSLKQIASHWRRPQVSRRLSREQRSHSLRISYAALLEWYRLAVWLNDVPFRCKPIMNKLNEQVPELGIGPNEGHKIVAVLADGKFRAKIDDSFHGFWRKIEKEGKSDKSFEKRIRDSYDFIDAREPLLLKAKWKNLVQKVKSSVFNEFYDLNMAVSSWIGDHKYLSRKPTIDHAMVQKMKPHLQPGDILLERENWFMSNIFLPGFWPHTIVYVGTAADLEKMGLADHPVVAPHMAKMRKPDRHGNLRCVIEAISEGVVQNSLEEACDADYIAAMRPRLSPEEMKKAIINCFSHLGKPYDFMFDFQTIDKLVCSELAYRSFNGMLTMNLRKIAGRWAMPSLALAELYAAQRNQSDRQLEFLFFVDSDIKTREVSFKNADEFVKTIRRPGFDPLLYQDFE